MTTSIRKAGGNQIGRCYITFVAWPMMKACMDQSELVNVGAQID